jgi:hypothetical protein
MVVWSGVRVGLVEVERSKSFDRDKIVEGPSGARPSTDFGEVNVNPLNLSNPFESLKQLS